MKIFSFIIYLKYAVPMLTINMNFVIKNKIYYNNFNNLFYFHYKSLILKLY